MFTVEEKNKRRCEASQRWRKRNPEKVRETERNREPRPYNAEKSKHWRSKRLSNPKYKAKINHVANNRAIAIRAFLDEYKITKGCFDCGYKTNAKALHFDHVKEKKSFNVCNSKSINGAKKEIKKCVVRCANCHCIITHQRLVNTIRKRSNHQN